MPVSSTASSESRDQESTASVTKPPIDSRPATLKLDTANNNSEVASPIHGTHRHAALAVKLTLSQGANEHELRKLASIQEIDTGSPVEAVKNPPSSGDIPQLAFSRATTMNSAMEPSPTPESPRSPRGGHTVSFSPNEDAIIPNGIQYPVSLTEADARDQRLPEAASPHDKDLQGLNIAGTSRDATVREPDTSTALSAAHVDRTPRNNAIERPGNGSMDLAFLTTRAHILRIWTFHGGPRDLASMDEIKCKDIVVYDPGSRLIGLHPKSYAQGEARERRALRSDIR